ncbi:uncharacterized protein LOC144209038 [Stigmatopora nigra]
MAKTPGQILKWEQVQIRIVAVVQEQKHRVRSRSGNKFKSRLLLWSRSKDIGSESKFGGNRFESRLSSNPALRALILFTNGVEEFKSRVAKTGSQYLSCHCGPVPKTLGLSLKWT